MRLFTFLSGSAALVLLFTVSGCATVSKRDITAVGASAPGEYQMPEEERWAIAQADKFHREFVKQGLVYSDPQLQTYLQGLEYQLLPPGELLEARSHIYFLKNPLPNAFAMPNGNVYIHAGLFAAVKTEAELLGVIAHEFAHVQQRHSVKAIVDQKNKLAVAHTVNLLSAGLDFGISYAVAGANVMAFSREQEMEADAVAVSFMEDAHLSADALLSAFENMSELPGAEHVESSIYSSHPDFDDRIVHLRGLITAEGDNNSVPGESAAFSRVRGRMLDDTVRSLIRKRQYLTAEGFINAAPDVFPDEGRTHFYRGEIYAGIARSPERAAREKYFLDTGKLNPKKGLIEAQEALAEENGEKAESYYLLAIESESPYLAAYKRLGEKSVRAGDPAAAIGYFESYLLRAANARDAAIVERKISRAQKQLNHKDVI